MESEFTTGYNRPQKLSDPCSDFTPAALDALLAKSDDEFDWLDYSSLFDPRLPAGNYDESIYFLPQAFSYLKYHEAEAFDLVTPMVRFCAKNMDQLTRDDLHVIVREKFSECLDYWARDFRVIHFNKKSSTKKGSGYDHYDLITNSEVICKAIAELVDSVVLKDIALNFLKSISLHSGNFSKAAWFLEYSKSRFDVYSPPHDEEVQALITRQDLLRSAYLRVEKEIDDEYSPLALWLDMLNELGIVADAKVKM